jgi:NAD(P)H-flavin reductase
MLQLCTAAAAEAAKGNDQHPQYSLLLGNRTANDILCKPELEQAEAAGVVALHYTLDKPPADWPHFTGFVDAPMLEKTMPPPGADTYIFCCGPPPMIKSAIAKLEALGHDPSHVLCF